MPVIELILAAGRSVGAVSTRYRVSLVTSRLLVAEGWLEREDEHADVPILHLIASRLIDRSDLRATLGTIDGQEDAAWAEKTLGRVDEVKRRAGITPPKDGADAKLPLRRERRGTERLAAEIAWPFEQPLSCSAQPRVTVTSIGTKRPGAAHAVDAMIVSGRSPG